MANSKDDAKVAIYWDFENIHACLNDRKYGREDYFGKRHRPQEVFVEIEPVLDYAASLGDVVIHKAYCNWQFFGKYQEQLNRAGMDLIQIFPRGWNAKNGADISLALDALTDIQQHPHITHVIIVSNDTDFVSLAQKIKQSGRVIIGVGLPVANRFWKSSCNEFKQYDALLELTRDPDPSPALPALAPSQPTNRVAGQPANPSPTQPPAPVQQPGQVHLDAQDPLKALNAARSVLTKGMRQLVESVGENSVEKGQLKKVLIRLNPAFDEGVPYKTFTGFLQKFPDVVTIVDEQHVALISYDPKPAEPSRLFVPPPVNGGKQETLLKEEGTADRRAEQAAPQ